VDYAAIAGSMRLVLDTRNALRYVAERQNIILA
jgi:hypothetical protein